MTNSNEGRAAPANLDCVRLRQWEGNAFSEPTKTKDLLGKLGELAIYRKERARVPDGKDKDKGSKLRWIHIASNDMHLCEDVLERICEQTQLDQIMSKDRWAGQLNEPLDVSETMENKKGAYLLHHSIPPARRYAAPDDRVETQFMDPAAFRLNFDIPEAISDPWLLRKVNDTDVPQPKEAPGIVRRSTRTVTSSILYMPYLHWANLEAHLASRGDKPGPPLTHPRRSLDQATDRYYSLKSLKDRDSDQVVTRYLEDHRVSYKCRTLMMIDQLWLWILDEETLVTSFPKTSCSCSGLNKDIDCPDLDLECLALRQAAKKARRKPTGAKVMASHLLYRCYSVFVYRKVGKRNLRYIDMFDKALADQRANSTELLGCLVTREQHGSLFGRRSPKGKNKRTKKLQAGVNSQLGDLNEDIKAVKTIRDTKEELHMILYVAEQQLKVLGEYGNTFACSSVSKFVDRIKALSSDAGSINDMLIQTLNLKQTQLSARQNEVVITFTVVTIIFLPLSFMASIFGMNAADFSDGARLSLRTIFTYIFPISIALSLVALVWAFWHDIADSIPERKREAKGDGASRSGKEASKKVKQSLRERLRGKVSSNPPQQMAAEDEETMESRDTTAVQV